jgi:nucleoside-diphosphate-sugar epimerase
MAFVRPESKEEGDYRLNGRAAERVVITGAGGFIGGHVLARFRAAGREVVGIVRPGARVQPMPGVRLVERDLATIPSLADVLQSDDTVVHLAARAHRILDDAADPVEAFRRANVEPVRMLCRSATEANIRRLIFISSAKVFGEGRERPYAVTDPIAPAEPYAQSKAEAERLVIQAGERGAFEWTILRPPFVYGPGGKGNFPRLVTLARLSTRVPLPLASIENRRSVIFVGNLADLILRAVEHPMAAGKVLLPTDAEDVSTPELLRAIAAAAGARARFFPCPRALLRTAARLIGRSADMDRLTESLRLDSRYLRELLDWQAPFTLERAVALSVGTDDVRSAAAAHG